MAALVEKSEGKTKRLRTLLLLIAPTSIATCDLIQMAAQVVEGSVTEFCRQPPLFGHVSSRVWLEMVSFSAD